MNVMPYWNKDDDDVVVVMVIVMAMMSVDMTFQQHSMPFGHVKYTIHHLRD